MIQICMRCYKDSDKCRCDKELNEKEIKDLIELLSHVIKYSDMIGILEFKERQVLYNKAIHYLNRLKTLI